MATNISNDFWSIEVYGIPSGLDKGYISLAFKIPHERITNPKQYKSRTRTLFINNQDNAECAKDFATKWSKSTVFGNTIRCTAFPSKDVQLRLIRLKLAAMSKDTSVLSKKPIAFEEKEYFNACKQYYQLTELPLVSISSEILNKDFESKSLSFKLGIDENYDNCDIGDFLGDICILLNIDGNDINITKIQQGSIFVCFDYIPKKTNNHSKSADFKLLAKSIYDKLTDKMKKELGKMKIFYIFMGDISTCEETCRIRHDAKLYPQYNRIYGTGFLNWRSALQDGRNRGETPYYCPSGWKRYSSYTSDDFEETFKGWSLCYQGTKFQNGLSMLLSGLKPVLSIPPGEGINVSPSIIYAAHPRTSEIREIQSSDQDLFFKPGRFVQFVLECRVHPKKKKKIVGETVRVGDKIIDPNIPSDKIEWILDNQGKETVDFNDPNGSIACTGLMIRVTDNDPSFLPDSKWWGYATQKGQCNIIYE